MAIPTNISINPVDFIAQKRDGQILSDDSIEAFINAYTNDLIPDYQMSAFLMAAYLNGLDNQETLALTRAMLHSGVVLDLGDIPGVKVDKHSTGGVGDKVSLLLAPIVAACGVPVPMISGRGLAHSGGTLDKLESIPGFQVDLGISGYKTQLAELDVVMIGQTLEIAPADRKIYALRDVTATIENVSFIVPSILSKKIAAGVDALVLDVKCGRGAFMQSEENARELAERLVTVSEQFGKPTVAWMTDMDQPLGYAVGNWPEMEESIRCLKGHWVEDLMTLTLTLAGEMLCLGGKAKNAEIGYELAKEAVLNGEAFDKLVQMVAAQGGNTDVLHDPGLYTKPAREIEVFAPDNAAGFVQQIDALEIGKLALELGAGRLQKEDDVDPQAGLLLAKKSGDSVQAGELLATLYTNRDLEDQFLSKRLLESFTFGSAQPDKKPLLIDRFTISGWDSMKSEG